MAGGVSGAASGGILGLCLVLLAQQFGYLTFTSLEQTIIDVVLVIFVFAVVFGIVGRILKASAINRAKKQAAEAGTPSPAAATGEPPAAPPADGSTPANPPPPAA